MSGSKIMKAGIYNDLSMVDYVADPCPDPSLSASTIRRLIDESPLKAWHRHPRLGGKVSHSTAADIGSAAHALVLEGPGAIQVVAKVTKADGEEIVPKNWATDAAKASRNRIRADGQVPLLPHEAGKVYEMAETAKKAILERAGEGRSEVTAIWQEDGIWCRSRSDWLPARHVVDYKTSKTAEPDRWQQKVLFGQRYDISAAWYLRGLKALGEPDREYLWLVQETDPPYDYSWHSLDGEAFDLANRIVEKAITVWRECLKTDRWPGYEKQTHYAAPPVWRAMRFEDRLLSEESR